MQYAVQKYILCVSSESDSEVLKKKMRWKSFTLIKNGLILCVTYSGFKKHIGTTLRHNLISKNGSYSTLYILKIFPKHFPSNNGNSH